MMKNMDPSQILKLRKEARRLLREEKVNLVIGYENTDDGPSTTPCFIEDEAEVERLTWNEGCTYNLSVYLNQVKGKVGIVTKGCDVKSIIGLIQENQIRREDVVIIGMECEKQMVDDGILEKCRYCQVHTPKIYDILIGSGSQGVESQKPTADPFEDLAELEGKSYEDRWAYWQKEFSKCIRCYACRQICPLCYCRECITDCNLPQWILRSPSLKGNTAWNIIRAYHLAGRCIGCGECERACPMEIPLSKLNKKMAKEIRELFGYLPGESWEVKPPLDDFGEEDSQDFIR